MEYVLKTSALSKRYKNFQALNGLSLNVPRGAIYGLVGKNGAGKTTLIRLICGLQEPTSGEFTLYGMKNTSRYISKSRKRIGAVVETPSLFLDMTAEENMKYQYKLVGDPDLTTIPGLLRLVGLGDTGKKKVRNFSLGMKQRLGIAIALVGTPDFLILDEPINGLDPQGIVEIRELILKLNQEMGITVLISSHILHELSMLATHYGFMDGGRVVSEIRADELEKKCRKYVKVKVDNLNRLIQYLDGKGMEYTVISDEEVNVYADPVVCDFVTELNSASCRVLALSESDESLESYFINLVGGAKA
ncbi:MAG: ABC transporter ATP-binding protein [Acutalibacteraceae bacterium]